MTCYWFDTEFMEDGERIELLSIGMVCEDGREYYAVSAGADLSHANPWVVDNVLPHLGGPQKYRAQIAEELVAFVAGAPTRPEFWAYYGDYDWVVLCQLFGRMIDLPEGWPMFAMDLKQLAVENGNPNLPEQVSTEHNALEDARWTRDAWEWLVAYTWQIKQISERLAVTYDPDGVRLYLDAFNRRLGGVPRQLVEAGQFDKVWAVVESIEGGAW